MNMTLDELLAEAKPLGEWYLNFDGLLRCDAGGFCPIVAVARIRNPRRYFTNAYWGEAGEELGLPEGLAAQVVMASDASEGYDPDLRRLMLDRLEVEK